MTEEWLIDGYNLLYDLKSCKDGPVTRERLLNRLADFASQTGRRLLVVLDGKGFDSEWHAFQTPQFQIVFSQSISADSYIEAALCQKKGQCRFFVVTRDRAITNMACGFGAHVLTTEQFRGLLTESDQERRDVLLRERVKSHTFNRPFDQKI